MTDHLRQAARTRHDQTLRRARAALRTPARRGEPITVRGVADAARVSRSWIYQQPDLLADIDRLRQPRASPHPAAPASRKPPSTHSASNCAPTGKRSPACEPRSPTSTTSSPATSALPAPQQ